MGSEPTEALRPLRRVWVIYNTDYDAELVAASGVDVSAVESSARVVCDAAAEFGYESELVGIHGLDLPDVAKRLMDGRPDLVFNLCESMNGDAQNEVLMPALLDMLRIRFTGTGTLGLGLCLHKDRAKDVLTSRGVPTPPHVVLATQSDLEQPLDLAYPYFLKLAHEDASIGITEANVARDRASLVARAAAMIDTYQQPVIAERFIDGREVNVTVMGNDDDLTILPLHEICFGDMPSERPRIVSYAAKWDENHVDYAGTKPVPLRDATPELRTHIERVAKAAYRAMGLRDFGRVDLRIDRDGQPWVIDVNPNCDVSLDAGVARSAKAAGISYPNLIGRICESAWTRYANDPRARTWR